MRCSHLCSSSHATSADRNVCPTALFLLTFAPGVSSYGVGDSMDSLPFLPPDPRELPAPEGEIFRRRTRAFLLMETAEFVDTERRAEISREIQLMGPSALPALSRAAA